MPALGLFAVGAAYWGFGMATGPAWNAWVGTIVPARLRARFFARRARFSQLALLVGIVTGGYGLELGQAAGGDVLLAFAVLFGLAGLARLVSSRLIATQSEAPGLAGRLEAIHLFGVLGRLRGREAGRIVAWLLAMQVVVNVAAPFFAPYMLGPLGLSYDGFMLLTATSFVSRVAVLPLLGRLAERGQAVRVLRLGALGIVPLPALWLVSDDFGYLLVLQAAAGCAWAAVELATLLAFFDGLEQEIRTSVLALYNVGSAAAVALGSLLGAGLFAALGADAAAYAALFAVSSIARMATLPLLRRVVPAARRPRTPRSSTRWPCAPHSARSSARSCRASARSPKSRSSGERTGPCGRRSAPSAGPSGPRTARAGGRCGCSRTAPSRARTSPPRGSPRRAA